MSRMTPKTYRGRFAPSPTGPLHLGSLACALSSWLDARAHDGEWLIRIEDIDPPRDVPGADEDILQTLKAFHLESDLPVVWQSDRHALYENAFQKLQQAGTLYGCSCSRSSIAIASAAAGLPPGVYPGTCRNGTNGAAIRSYRFRVDAQSPTCFADRICGEYAQDVLREVGDFVLKRADGLWAYQLAVVVDDAEQGITHIVRGRDLLDNTPRQILLQRALGFAQPVYMHIGLITDASGNKLSKQNKAPRVPADNPLKTLESLWPLMGFPRIGAQSLDAFLRLASELWAERYCSRAC
jgi:glutamyl-Q tRNA(Asp) synthetase